MLHRSMSTNSITVKLRLDDVLGDLQHARRTGNIGRLALLAYCEVRRWARIAGEQELAEHSTDLVMKSPHSTRDEFLSGVDSLIEELQSARSRLD
jgi:hypothetical protein